MHIIIATKIINAMLISSLFNIPSLLIVFLYSIFIFLVISVRFIYYRQYSFYQDNKGELVSLILEDVQVHDLYNKT